MYPVATESGIQLMSINLLLEDAAEPVLWRGPVIAGVAAQFWSEVLWDDVDFMFVDMPPGTGDVPLTVLQGLPVDGVVIVTSPQDLVGMIVEKAVRMSEMMKVPVLTLVENMSYYICPKCGEMEEIFGESHAAEQAAAHGIPSFIRLPINPDAARLMDAGRVEDIDCGYVSALADTVLCRFGDVPPRNKLRGRETGPRLSERPRRPFQTIESPALRAMRTGAALRAKKSAGPGRRIFHTPLRERYFRRRTRRRRKYFNYFAAKRRNLSEAFSAS